MVLKRGSKDVNLSQSLEKIGEKKMLWALPTFFWYALFGAGIRLVFEFWRAYQTFVDIKISGKRMVMTFLFAFLFGFIGGIILERFNFVPGLGIDLGAFLCGILSGNSINFFAKKLGFTGKLEEPISDEQIISNLTPRQMNALTVAQKTGKVTNKTHQKINSVSRNSATYDLQNLVSRGKLVRKGSGRGVYYMLPGNAYKMRNEKTRKRSTHKSRINYSRRARVDYIG